MKFNPAPIDTFAKVVTVSIFIILIFSLIGGFLFTDYFWASIIVCLILTISIFVSYTLKPTFFELNNQGLIVHRPFDRKKVLKNITDLEIVHANGVKTLGVGGLFGYYGYFNGGEVWFVTNRRKSIKFKSNDKTYIISPENPSEFILNFDALKANSNNE